VSAAARQGYALDRVDWNDPLSYVREMYGVPAALNGRVFFNGDPGTIIGAEGQYLLVRPEDGREPLLLHPTWKVTYVVP